MCGDTRSRETRDDVEDGIVNEVSAPAAWNVSPDLSFGSDQTPGIRRTGTKRFRYVDEVTGRPAGDDDLL